MVVAMFVGCSAFTRELSSGASIQTLSRWFIVTNITTAVMMITPHACKGECATMTHVWEEAGKAYRGMLWTSSWQGERGSNTQLTAFNSGVRHRRS